MLSTLARTSLRGSQRSFASLAAYEEYGKQLFKGTVADKYLKAHGASAELLKDPSWTEHSSDVVAAAVLDWAIDNGADTYCHWFQPMGASGVRHGLSGQVQNKMLEFDRETGDLKFDFKGKTLVKGETDGSSFPNGGLRGTHCAGGYLAVDTSSPIFCRGDTVFIPSAFVSYFGASLDEKTSLLRSNQALSNEGTRLLGLLGYKVDSLVANIGLEQEIFLIPRDAYHRRPDLMITGRTIIGKDAPRGQEMCDHYMGPLSAATPALGCMQEIQEECWKLGIPLKTRHREVAPNQFEFAPLFGTNTTQIDQNIMVMQIIEEVASKWGLAALLQEKPFNNVNGSGKHNNWSIGTSDGVNLLNPEQITKASGSDDAFALVMTAIVSAINDHGDLMRCSIAAPGNDFRLGACEAPPAIVSTYLGEDMTTYLEARKNGKTSAYSPGTKTLDLNTSAVMPFQVPAEDRNRTSPFPYGGARFEFRAVGSSQNTSFTNTVLNTMTAQKFKEFADAIENGATPAEVISKNLDKSWKTIFNGNNYDIANQEMLTGRGCWRIDSGVEAINVLTNDKNKQLFSGLNVMTAEECDARAEIMHDHYSGVVEMEALTLIDMINQHIIPSCKEAAVGPVSELFQSVQTAKDWLAKMHAAKSSYEKAKIARKLRLEVMIDIRAVCDSAEAVCPADKWTLATYNELLFLDQTDLGGAPEY
jgi:glutamine synthetase